MKGKIFKEEKNFTEDINKLRPVKEDIVQQLSKIQTKETKWKYEIQKKKLNQMTLKIN